MTTPKAPPDGAPPEADEAPQEAPPGTADATLGPPQRAPGKLERAAETAPAPEAVPGAGGPPPDSPFRGRNAGIATGRPTEDDRAGAHHHDGWNSNT